MVEEMLVDSFSGESNSEKHNDGDSSYGTKHSSVVNNNNLTNEQECDLLHKCCTVDSDIRMRTENCSVDSDNLIRVQNNDNLDTLITSDTGTLKDLKLA